MRNLFAALVATTVCFIGASTVSAQDSCPAHAHLNTTVTACGAGGVDFACACACDRGYSARDGGVPAADNPCVRDAPSYGSYRDPLCATGATRGSNGECDCPESLGARRHRVLTVVSHTFAESISSQIEDYASIRRGDRLPVALMVCIDPMATGTAPGSLPQVLSSALDQAVRILCAAPEGATDEQLLQACRDTRALIDGFRPTIIHYGDHDYTVQEFVSGPLTERLGNIEQQLANLTGRVTDLEGDVADHEARISALEDADHPATPDGPNSFTLTLGAMAELGFATYGPMTLSGDAMATGLFRPGTASLDIYLRLRGGGAFTGWSTGSAHIVASAGASFYLDSHLRRGLTLMVGFAAEDLLDLGPDGPGQVRGDTIGFAAGGEVNVGIPVGDTVHIELGAFLGYSERYGVGSNGADLAVFPGFYIAPHIGVTAQLF
jgi:hypothetical protein